MKVNIILFDDFETLDAFGPAQIFGKLPEYFSINYLSVNGGNGTGIRPCFRYSGYSGKNSSGSWYCMGFRE